MFVPLPAMNYERLFKGLKVNRHNTAGLNIIDQSQCYFDLPVHRTVKRKIIAGWR